MNTTNHSFITSRLVVTMLGLMMLFGGGSKVQASNAQAYPKFGQWAKDMEDIHAQDWYLYPDEKLVMDIDNDKLLTHEEQENLGWHKE